MPPRSACRPNTSQKSCYGWKVSSEIEYVDQPIAKGLTVVEEGRADMTMGAAPDVVAALMQAEAFSRWRASMPVATSFVNGPITGSRSSRAKAS